VFAASSLGCAAAEACRQLTVESRVVTAPGELTLADLLERGSCPQLREAAARVSLGAVPRAGSVRVLDGREVRQLLERLKGGDLSLERIGSTAIPDRIVVTLRGATKSCAEIAGFVAGAAAAEDMANAPSRWREDLDCAGARGIPEEAPLELAKSGWSVALERWEFALRCVQPGDCIPFMVWVRASKAAVAVMASLQSGARRAPASGEFFQGLAAGANGAQRLVKAGQTATLTWDQAGIRAVLPVTCLDAGGLGQFVRVRLTNTARILRAEVMGEGILRVNL
jgi:hypothetical protein